MFEIDRDPTAYDLFPYVILHENNSAVKHMVHTNAYAILTSPTIDGELTMQNKIRVSPQRFDRMMQDEFWKKMYENCPEKFEITDQPPKEEGDEQESNDN